MDLRTLVVLVTVLLSSVIMTSHGHGRLVEPPGRASMWRYGFNTPVDYNDNQLFCGGFDTQWNQNGGKCGVCGDNWADSQPRAHEGGGTWGTGTIARTYTQGQDIDVSVQITASHQGWFEFRLCPNNDVTTVVTQSCLDQYLLEFQSGPTRVYGISSAAFYNYTLHLPSDVTCSQCVLQWKYNTGNSWGTDPVTGQQGLGFGPQEQFYGCADITINPPTTTTPSSTSATTPSTTSTITTSTQSSTSTSNDPSTTTETTTSSTSTQTTTTPSSTSTSTDPSTTQSTSIDTSTMETTATSTQSTSTTTSASTHGCHAIGVWASVSGMDAWCAMNCANGYCPATHCTC